MKKYLITPKSGELVYKQLSTHLPDFALYRDKTSINYSKNAKEFVSFCKKLDSVKSIVHRDIQLAKELGAYGVHLTSTQYFEIKNAKKLGLKVFVSTHSLEELETIETLGADFATYSPIFASPNKGKPKGIENLKEILKCRRVKVFALGGIVTKQHIEQISKTDVFGFASIRYFE